MRLKQALLPRLLTHTAEPSRRWLVRRYVLEAKACMQESVFSISQVLSAPPDQTIYPVGQSLELPVQYA
jgi:hypothetical protein